MTVSVNQQTFSLHSNFGDTCPNPVSGNALKGNMAGPQAAFCTRWLCCIPDVIFKKYEEISDFLITKKYFYGSLIKFQYVF